MWPFVELTDTLPQLSRLLKLSGAVKDDQCVQEGKERKNVEDGGGMGRRWDGSYLQVTVRVK